MVINAVAFDHAVSKSIQQFYLSCFPLIHSVLDSYATWLLPFIEQIVNKPVLVL